MARHNISRRVFYRAGWAGAFSGESQGKALDRELARLNDDGYRLTFVVEDRWNVFLRLWWLLIAVVTLGIYVKTPNLLVVGERFDAAHPGPEHANTARVAPEAR